MAQGSMRWGGASGIPDDDDDDEGGGDVQAGRGTVPYQRD